MKALPENQRQIMEYLVSLPEGATPEELSAHLGITNTATKAHILKLSSLGYLSFVDTKGAVGRPRRRYRLSAEGQEVFPRQYSWLSNILLEHLAKDLGVSGLSRIMKGLAEEVAKSMAPRLNKRTTPAELFAEITEVLNELGYRATLRQSDIRKGPVIEATNCVYHSVAKRHPHLCQFDVHFMENASKMKVKLQQCIARGDSVCRFCFQNR